MEPKHYEISLLLPPSRTTEDTSESTKITLYELRRNRLQQLNPAELLMIITMIINMKINMIMNIIMTMMMMTRMTRMMRES